MVSLGDRAFGKWLGHEDGALMDGVSAQHFRDNFYCLFFNKLYLFIYWLY